MSDKLKETKLNSGSGRFALYFGAALAASSVAFFFIFSFPKGVYEEAGRLHDRHYALLSTAASLLKLDSSLTIAARRGAATGRAGYAAEHERLLASIAESITCAVNSMKEFPRGKA